jgi:hypothetical protein
MKMITLMKMTSTNSILALVERVSIKLIEGNYRKELERN